ncbi:MerR family transcriptional regulator [Brevibacillus ginsengisoli]|uniref:MerR family transcriptional regulator n=1 Tax=Brevibacillus ginsengisoli TaxID=363854 RepID=UPI003CF007D1
MDKHYGIKEIAILSGISEHTLRYYEKNGLIHSISRDTKGHRLYSEQDLGWIRFLVRLRTTGMSIRQMQEIAELRRQGPATSKERRVLLEAHQQKVTEHIEQLQEHMEALVTKIAEYREWEKELEEKNGRKSNESNNF